jgi:sulfur carrier protein ThiS
MEFGNVQRGILGVEGGELTGNASKELGIKEVPVIIFRNGGIIDSENALDKILEEAEPFIDSVYEKRIELIELLSILVSLNLDPVTPFFFSNSRTVYTRR